MDLIQKAVEEYNAQAASQSIAGEVRLTVGTDALMVTALFDAVEVPYAQIRSLTLEDYSVRIESDSGVYRFSRMGSESGHFYEALYAAYNNKVRKVLFVSEPLLFKTQGQFRSQEYNATAFGSAPFEVYRNCVLILPPNEGAKRIPLCFVTSLEKDPYTLTLCLGPEESYTFSGLGYDMEPFSDVLAKQLHTLRESALLTVKKIDPALTSMQASAIARLMPEGVAAPIGELAGIAPSFVVALEKDLAKSRSSQEYDILKSICDPARIYIGMKKRFKWGVPDTAEDAELSGASGESSGVNRDAVSASRESMGENLQEDGILWVIAPGENGNTAVVEFAVAGDESAATFIYRFDGSFRSFVHTFNRALEAISFRREAIRLSEDELRKPEYMMSAMAVRRNAALRYVRGCFAGRVVHTSPESWRKALLTYIQ